MNRETDTTSEPGVAVVGRRARTAKPAESDKPAESAESATSAKSAEEAGAAEAAGEVAEAPGTRETGRGRVAERGRASLAKARSALWASRGSETLGTRSVRRQPRFLVPVLLVVTAVSLLLAIGFAVAWAGLNSQQQTRSTVRHVASEFLHDLTSFNPSNLDSRLATVETFATGDFAKQANQFFGTSIRQALEQVQASSAGQVRYIYVQSLSGNHASVYAWVDETFTNNKLTGNQTDVLQVVLSMLDTSRGWKISDVSVLNSPSPLGSQTGGG